MNTEEHHAQFGRTICNEETGYLWLTPQEAEELKSKGYYTRDKSKYNRNGMFIGGGTGNDILRLKGICSIK